MNFDMRPDGKQFFALVLMIAAIGVLSFGEVGWGMGIVLAAAGVSIGGMFYDAHRADASAAEQQGSEADRSAVAQRTP